MLKPIRNTSITRYVTRPSVRKDESKAYITGLIVGWASAIAAWWWITKVLLS